MSLEPLETAEGSDYPGCRQLSIFLENHVGQLLRLTRTLDGEDIHILGLTVESSIDCAILRIVVDDPDMARRMISEAGFACTESDVIIVELPTGKRGILAVSAALIAAEVNINYAYTLLNTEAHGRLIAIQVDNMAQAAAVLSQKRFHLIDQNDL